MTRKPNYSFERNKRANAKAAKREAKREAKTAAREAKAKKEAATDSPAGDDGTEPAAGGGNNQE